MQEQRQRHLEEKRARAAGKLGPADLQTVEAGLPAGAGRHQEAAPGAAAELGSVELARLHGGAGLPAAAVGPDSDKLAGPDSKASTDSLEDWVSPLDGVLGTADDSALKGCTGANREQPLSRTIASGAETANVGAQRKGGVAAGKQIGTQHALPACKSGQQPTGATPGPWQGLSTSQRLRLLLRHYGFRLLGTCLGWAFMDAFYYGELTGMCSVAAAVKTCKSVAAAVRSCSSVAAAEGVCVMVASGRALLKI